MPGFDPAVGRAAMGVRQQREKERVECQRRVSEVMDNAPEWRDWFADQLALLDMRYDPHHWIRMETIRG